MPDSAHQSILPRPAEQLLIQKSETGAIDCNGKQVLTTTLGRAQLAHALAINGTVTSVDCWFVDQYQTNRARHYLGELPESLNLMCLPDPPDRTYDMALLPLGRRGETEFVRDQLQCLFNRLRIGGELWVCVDNPTDSWVGEQVKKLPCDVTVSTSESTTAYCCVKQNELKKQKSYHCEFAIRDRGRLLKVHSRPSVFSHRRIDPGARHLINAMSVGESTKVLDLGCGSGTISLAAAAIDPSVVVHSIDSNARAVQCTSTGADLNQLENVSAMLSDCGDLKMASDYDLVVANPPYYADFRIAELFLQTAHQMLRSGGRVMIVGKDEAWYIEQMPVWFHSVTVEPVKGYVIAQGIRL
ncbi:MAG: methyltransferase [Pirellulaceae bacterium]